MALLVHAYAIHRRSLLRLLCRIEQSRAEERRTFVLCLLRSCPLVSRSLTHSCIIAMGSFTPSHHCVLLATQLSFSPSLTHSFVP